MSRKINIMIKGLQGTTQCVQLLQTDTISNLIQVVAKKLNYPKDQMRLIHAGKEIQQSKYQKKTLQEQGLGNFSYIHVVFRLRGGSNQQSLEILSDTQPSLQESDVDNNAQGNDEEVNTNILNQHDSDKNDLIGDVQHSKDDIEEAKFDEDDSEADESIISVVTLQTQTKVFLPSGRMIVIKTHPEDMISEIKQKIILQCQKLKVHQFTLRCNQIEFQDDKPLKDYDIEKDDILKCRHLSYFQPGNILQRPNIRLNFIYIDNVKGQICEFKKKINAKGTIEFLKFNIPLIKQHYMIPSFYYFGEKLQEKQSLTYYSIKNNNFLYIQYTPTAFEIKVDTINIGQVIKVMIHPNETILQVKKKVVQQCKVLEPNYMTLIWAGVQLQNSKKVSRYDINGGDVFQQTKVGLTQGQGFIISFGECVYLLGEDGEPNAKMPCGHIISTDGMTGFIRSQIAQNKHTIKCMSMNRQNKPCNQEWKFAICKKIGIFTQNETKEFEEGLSQNKMNEMGVKNCPACFSFLIRECPNKKIVRCVVCQKNDQKTNFCWICLNIQTTDNTQNNCLKCSGVDKRNIILSTCGTKKIMNIENVPDTRACPRCYTLIHHTEACKHMKCNGCNQEFCFICLSLKDKKNQWSCGSYESTCQLAKRQKL